MTRALAALAALTLLGGCGTMFGTLSRETHTDTFCTAYKPVYWATSDTRETKEAVDTNNRKWKARCQK